METTDQTPAPELETSPEPETFDEMVVPELETIRENLSRLYDLDAPEVAPFLCTHEETQAAVGDGVARGEVLLVQEQGNDIAVGLFVCEAAIEAMRQGDQAGWLLATEGVSHFVYLLFRAENADSVTQLELELQAEVDKYATALLDAALLDTEAQLSGWGVGLIRARDQLAQLDRSRRLRASLFADPAFLDEPGTEQGHRYRLANRAAARYTAWLEHTFVVPGDQTGLVRELRRFYRLGQTQKLSRAFAGS